jgi:hypothetical protein
MTAPKHALFDPDENLAQPEKDLIFEIQMHTIAYHSSGKGLSEFDYKAEVDRISSLFRDPNNPVTMQARSNLLAKLRPSKVGGTQK